MVLPLIGLIRKMCNIQKNVSNMKLLKSLSGTLIYSKFQVRFLRKMPLNLLIVLNLIS